MRGFLLKVSENASTAMDYAVIAALVSIIAIPIWQVIGTRMSEMFFGSVGNAFTHVSGGV